MKITYVHYLSQPLVSAVSSGMRRPESKVLHVTELIDSPQIRQLKMTYWDEIVVDASDMIWMLLGKAIHRVLECADTDNHLSEETMYINFKDWKIIGTPDLLGPDGILRDYKVTSVFSFLLGDKQSWNDQLNVYKYLYEKHGFNVKGLEIEAILRDWQKSRALREPDYPQCGVFRKEIPFTDAEEKESYVISRLQ